MSDRLNLEKPYIELGNQPKGQADYVWQDGQIFAWSESNIRYEVAWWLAPNGTLISNERPLLFNIAKDRPFDPAWLSNVNQH